MTEETVVGWFMVAFKNDPNHEYPFVLHKDGTILPEVDLIEVTPTDRAVFAKYLADPDLHHVLFFQQTPISPQEMEDFDGRATL